MLTTTGTPLYSSAQAIPYAGGAKDMSPATIFADLLGGMPQGQQAGLSYNCHEDQEGIVFIFDVPGVRKEDVVVEVIPPSAEQARHRLSVRVSRAMPAKAEGQSSWREERVRAPGG